MKLFRFLVFLILFSVSCQTETVFKPYTANELYSVEVPDYMQYATFESEASMKFESKEKEMYFLVIDESKDSLLEYDLEYDLETYFTFTASNFDTTRPPVPSALKINGLNALSAEIKGSINNQPVIYRVVTIESPAHFYKMIMWTIESTFERNKNDFDHMVNSFREVRKPGV